MKDKIFLYINPKRVDRMRRQKAITEPNEIVVEVIVEVPNEIFLKPQFKSNLIVDKEQINMVIEQYQTEIDRLKEQKEE